MSAGGRGWIATAGGRRSRCGGSPCRGLILKGGWEPGACWRYETRDAVEMLPFLQHAYGLVLKGGWDAGGGGGAGGAKDWLGWGAGRGEDGGVGGLRKLCGTSPVCG